MKQPKKGKITEKIKWRKFFNGTHLSTNDVDTDITLTIKEMRYDDVTSEGGRTDSCLVAVWTDPETLPMIINVVNSKTISNLYNSIYPVDWVGKKVTVFSDPSVMRGKERVGGLRIRPVIPTLPSISEQHFAIMIQRIKEGKYSKQKALESFTFTDAQQRIIDNEK